MTYPIVPPEPLASGATQAEVAAVASVIAGYVSEQKIVDALKRLWPQTDKRAIAAAVRMTDSRFGAHRGTRPTPRLRGLGPAAREARQTELWYRSAYIANAAHRVAQNLDDGMDLESAIRREMRYYLLHEAARRNRLDTANRVDSAAEVYGALLGWYAHQDDRATPECLAADKSNFRAGNRPRIGYPGGVHLKCRCWPGPPFATARTVDGVTRGISH